ncbi:hypothetical protein BSLG_005848 [Batrachochytrium salamandrivorans]|nr:hypothetical protein BSLG_005848 [Batrachochytrium salamandrivorans]
MVSSQPITGKAIAEPLIAQPYATQSSQAGQQEWIAYGDSWVTLEFYMKEKARREQEKETPYKNLCQTFMCVTCKQSDQIIPDRMIESSRETLQDCHSARVISHPPLAQTISFKNMHREAQQPSIPRQKSMPNSPTAKTILVSVDPIKQTLNQSQTNLIKTATDPESKVEREPTFPKHCAITKQDMKIQVSETDPIPIGQSGTNAQNALSTTTLHDEDFDAILE